MALLFLAFDMDMTYMFPWTATSRPRGHRTETVFIIILAFVPFIDRTDNRWWRWRLYSGALSRSRS